MFCAANPDLYNGDDDSGLLSSSLVPFGMYYGVEHAHCLSHHWTLWLATSSECRPQCGVVDDIPVYGPCDAGCALKFF